MTQPIPTVQSMLDATRISHRVHRWPTEGGSIDVAADVLRPALEAACDRTMANWPAMVEIATMHASDWENIARCAHARYEALYHEAMETGEKTFYFHRTFITWGPLHDRAVRDLETCLMARLVASKCSNA